MEGIKERGHSSGPKVLFLAEVLSPYIISSLFELNPNWAVIFQFILLEMRGKMRNLYLLVLEEFYLQEDYHFFGEAFKSMFIKALRR